MNVLARRSLYLFVVVAALLLSVVLPVSAQGGGTRTEQGAAFLTQNNIPPEAYRELSAYATNPQKLAETLIKYGYTPEQAQTFLTPQNVFTLGTVLNPGASNEVLAQAMAILAPYNLTAADLETLLPHLTDPAAMVAALMQKGLSQEQATEILTQAAPVIQQANEKGLLQYVALNKQLEATLSQAGFDTSLMYQVGNIINDPEALAARLAELGYTAEQIQNFQGVAAGMAAQGITSELIEGWTVKNMIYRLEGIGLEPAAINEIIALGSIDAVRAHLEELGYSGEQLELALVNIEGCMGPNGEVMDPERLENFQTAEASALLEQAGIDPADLGAILEMRGDPDALSAYLEETYGMNAEQIAAFTGGLDGSTFAQTVDPEDAEAFAESVEIAAEEDMGEEVGEEEVGEEEGDAGEEEEYSEEEASEDAGGDAGEESGDAGGGESGEGGEGE